MAVVLRKAISHLLRVTLASETGRREQNNAPHWAPPLTCCLVICKFPSQDSLCRSSRAAFSICWAYLPFWVLAQLAYGYLFLLSICRLLAAADHVFSSTWGLRTLSLKLPRLLCVWPPCWLTSHCMPSLFSSLCWLLQQLLGFAASPLWSFSFQC